MVGQVTAVISPRRVVALLAPGSDGFPGCPLPMVAPRFRLRFLNELFSPCRRHVAGAASFRAGSQLT
jgi:hypothetical protein